MEIIERIADLRDALAPVHPSGKSIGFVPTMGALHEGHLSLLRRARAENDLVVMSLFVNPTQFNDPSDFAKYPRTIERDCELAAAVGTEMVFAPAREEMYPEGAVTVVTVPGLSQILEGASRPGHFDGVATVVAKLFNIVAPTRAYFGEKDYQQLLVIRRMVADLNMPFEIVPCPIVREADGLAMSSRNVRLSAEERQAATVLSRALAHAQEMADAGIRDAGAIAGEIARIIQLEPLATLDYAVIVDRDTLQSASIIVHSPIALVAATFGKVRLIDNHIIETS